MRYTENLRELLLKFEQDLRELFRTVLIKCRDSLIKDAELDVVIETRKCLSDGDNDLQLFTSREKIEILILSTSIGHRDKKSIHLFTFFRTIPLGIKTYPHVRQLSQDLIDALLESGEYGFNDHDLDAVDPECFLDKCNAPFLICQGSYQHPTLLGSCRKLFDHIGLGDSVLQVPKGKGQIEQFLGDHVSGN